MVDCFRCIDKLDKAGKEAVEKELKEKGIDTQILGQLDEKKLKGLKLKNNAPLQQLQELLQLLEKNKLGKFVQLDLCLARGLEYYTGMVFEVCVKELPEEGRANEAIIKVLAKYFNIAPSRIELVGGKRSKQKVFEIK